MEKKMMDIQALLELLERRDLHALRAALLEENEVDIAEFLEELPQDKIVVVFRALPKEMAAEVFSNLEPDTQQVIIQSATDRGGAVRGRRGGHAGGAARQRGQAGAEGCPP